MNRIIKFIKRNLKNISDEGFSGFQKYLIFADMIFCLIYFHATPNEYILYKLYNYKNRYRKQFLLVYHQRKTYQKVNIKGFTRNKMKTYNDLKPFFARDIIHIPLCGANEFAEFVKKHRRVVLKPENGSMGSGIEIYEYTNQDDALEKFVSLSSHKYLCEEFIIQHSALNKLNYSSVNTVRVSSVYDSGEVKIIAALLRMGISDCVDNLCSGGIGADIDIETGIVISYGKDYNGNQYINHPLTDSRISGFKVPNWDKVIDTVTKAHTIYKACPILGWDLAIRENDVVIVEVNNAPGPKTHQYISGVPKGKEILNYIQTNKK